MGYVTAPCPECGKQRAVDIDGYFWKCDNAECDSNNPPTLRDTGFDDPPSLR